MDMTPDDRELKTMWNKVVAEDPPEMAFEVKRAIDDNMAPSEEAFTAVFDAMHVFVGAKLIAKWNQTDKAPQRIRIIVQVECGSADEKIRDESR